MKHLILAIALAFTFQAYADLDQHQQQGLKDTQTLLKNKEQRDAYIRKDKSAADVDQKVEALAGSGADKEEIYGLSASVMEKITQETNGDPEKMQKILLEAQKNPEAFKNKYFSAGDQAKLKKTVDKIESKKTNAPGRN